MSLGCLFKAADTNVLSTVGVGKWQLFCSTHIIINTFFCVYFALSAQ